MLYGQIKVGIDPALLSTGIGALGGGALGALIPSTDEHGETHRLRNALIGATGGGALGYGYSRFNTNLPSSPAHSSIIKSPSVNTNLTPPDKPIVTSLINDEDDNPNAKYGLPPPIRSTGPIPTPADGKNISPVRPLPRVNVSNYHWRNIPRHGLQPPLPEPEPYKTNYDPANNSLPLAGSNISPSGKSEFMNTLIARKQNAPIAQEGMITPSKYKQLQYGSHFLKELNKGNEYNKANNLPLNGTIQSWTTPVPYKAQDAKEASYSSTWSADDDFHYKNSQMPLIGRFFNPYPKDIKPNSKAKLETT